MRRKELRQALESYRRQAERAPDRIRKVLENPMTGRLAMPRIRTIKPEFWESETIATLSLPARLTFVACLNLADDEGLLRWHPAHVKAFAFPYDDEILTEQVSEWMDELVTAGLIYPYRGAVKTGHKQTQYGWIVGFLEHQRINRPSPSKYPPPNLQSPEVRRRYAERNEWVCQISGEPIEAGSARYRGDTKSLSLDHIVPKSEGGTDYPSNIRATTQSANRARGNRDIPGELSDSLNDSLNDSGSDSLPEGKGRERKGKEGKGVTTAPSPAASSPPFIELPLNDKTLHPVTEADIARWQELYPAVDVKQQLRNMRGWLDGSPHKRKTARGVERFIVNWLSREQDRGGARPPPTVSSGHGHSQTSGKIGRAMAAINGGKP